MVAEVNRFVEDERLKIFRVYTDEKKKASNIIIVIILNITEVYSF